ncbi:hypothetical protein Ancab_038445 [Ancistrocladus abbreviatus]
MNMMMPDLSHKLYLYCPACSSDTIVLLLFEYSGCMKVALPCLFPRYAVLHVLGVQVWVGEQCKLSPDQATRKQQTRNKAEKANRKPGPTLNLQTQQYQFAFKH